MVFSVSYDDTHEGTGRDHSSAAIGREEGERSKEAMLKFSKAL